MGKLYVLCWEDQAWTNTLSTPDPPNKRPKKRAGEGMKMGIRQPKEELVHEAKKAAKKTKKAANRTRGKTWFHVIARIGYFVRGILYGLIGYLAIQLIIWGRGELAGRQDALEVLAQQPLGGPVLILVAVGLLGMMLWSIIRAITDPDNVGHGLAGIAARVGKVVTGLSYGALLFPTLNMLFGLGNRGAEESEQAQQAAAGILGYSWGPWLVGAVGLALMLIGANRIRNGLQANLDERFKTYKMTPEQLKWSKRFGRIGAAAQGMVMITIGILAMLAAMTLEPEMVGGIDGAMLFLASRPYGPYILGLVAAGLIAYAIYSILGALWFRVED